VIREPELQHKIIVGAKADADLLILSGARDVYKLSGSAKLVKEIQSTGHLPARYKALQYHKMYLP
jgi:hypothetical protein